MAILYKNLVGQKFGKWTVLEDVRAIRKRHYLCRCECGRKREVADSQLVCGRSKQCRSCVNTLTKTKDTLRKNNRLLYAVYRGMKQRCLNPKSKDYKDYGERGIKVCDRWLESFENFLEDMGKRPEGNYSIDRINNDGNYEQSNCRWATAREQQHNTRKFKKTALTNLLTLKNTEWKLTTSAT